MLRGLGRLYFIHLTALLAILAAMYFPGLGLLLALIYLAVIYQEGRRLTAALEGDLFRALMTAVLWQLPALILITVNFLQLSSLGGLYHYSFFMLEIWQTQLLPLLSFLPASWLIQGHPVYYYLYTIDIFLLILLVTAPTLRYRLFRRKYWF
jgi:hypothetical protein